MTGLEAWLKQATRHLAGESAAQVRREIQQHFELARDAAAADGATADQAYSLALNALGDARIANRQYRRVLLTAAEARILCEGDWEARVFCSRPWLKWLIVSVPVMAVAVAIALFVMGRDAARDVLTFGVAISPLLAAPLLPVYTPLRSRVFRCMKWALMMAAFALVFGPELMKWSWLLICCLWPMASADWTRAAIRRKLPVAAWPRHLYL